jgi:hypothetical protein
MTEHSSGQGRSDDWSRGYTPGEQYGGEQYAGEQYYGAGTPGSSRPGYENPGQGGQRGGAGAARPAPGTAGQAGPAMPTSPIWQATPGQGGPGQAGPGQAGPGQGGQGYGPPGQGGPGQAGPGQAGFGAGATPPAGAPAGSPAMGVPPMGRPQSADARGFLGALFDLSFTSFVTTKIIKVLYALILVMVSLSALVFTISAFRSSAVFGLLVLVIGDPLFIIIVMAFWRLVLESFVVVFRIAEDIRALRERGERGR